MIHGFGGGSACFIRMTPLLQDYYECWSIDLLGMGASGRPDVSGIKDQKQALGFFTDSLKAFVDKSKLNLDPFILLGHSFGALIAAEYALLYPGQIEHLILMSPLGMPKVPEQRDY